MENVNKSQHRGPVPGVIIKPEALARERARKQDGKKGDLTESEKLEIRRAAARAYYHSNKEHALAQKKEKYRKTKNLPAVVEPGTTPPVPRRPSKVDALVAVNRSVRFAQQGDLDGAELWGRFAARIIEGKE